MRAFRDKRFVHCGHFVDKERGVLQMWTSKLFVAKTQDFYGARTDAVEAVDQFSLFCADAFHGLPLTVIHSKRN